MLFALYAEAHGLLPTDNDGYRDTYSIWRIKHDLAARIDGGTALLRTADNYYANLKNLFGIIDDGAHDSGFHRTTGASLTPRSIRFFPPTRSATRF